MSNQAVLYSKPKCQQCTATARKLNSLGIKYVTVDLSESPDALAEIKALGYLQAPVLYINEKTHWSGYRPDLIEEHLT